VKKNDPQTSSPPAEHNVVAESATEVLANVRQQGSRLATLRALWENRQRVVWTEDIAIYRLSVDSALKLGEAFLAYDIAREGLEAFAGDIRLLQLQALALARTGATKRANAILGKLRKQGHDDEETFGILARTNKDFWMIATSEEEREYHLRSSLDYYLKGYKSSGGYYTGINAASMALVAGETDTARRIANEVRIICEDSLTKTGSDSPELYWLQATAAEAALVSGDMDTARLNYTRATTENNPGASEVSRTRSQARFLLKCQKEDEHALDDCFALPRIGLFIGHMLDRLDRPLPRFPATLEETVRGEIEACLERRNVQLGFSSLACGGDLLFAESVLKRGGEVHVILPFDIETFKINSVLIIPQADLEQRFHRVLDNAASVRILSDRGDPQDSAGYDYGNLILNGAATLKGQLLGMDIARILLWDGNRGDGGGGTESAHSRWSDSDNHEVEVLPMNKILANALANGLVLPEQPPKKLTPSATKNPDQTPQEIRAMLFTDVVGFSSWPEHCIPRFIREFFGRVADLEIQSNIQPLYVNTWGDAICAVFENVEDAGRFALMLQNTIRETDWKTIGLPTAISIRIGLHAGPVYKCFDPLLGKDSYNGAHVNQAARIEPIAEDGQIFASDAFAALATTTNAGGFICDYAGTRKLPKGAGIISTFLVRPLQ